MYLNKKMKLLMSLPPSDINDDISRDIFTKYGFDEISSGILFDLFNKYEIKIVCMADKCYVQKNTIIIEMDHMFSEETRRKGGIQELRHSIYQTSITSYFNILLNIQDGIFHKTCRHLDRKNHGSCCGRRDAACGISSHV